MTLIDLLVAFGICFMFQHKLPFLRNKLRWLDSMLECTYCTGFHAGWMTWLLTCTVRGHLLAEGSALPGSILAWSFASSVGCYILDVALNWLEES